MDVRLTNVYVADARLVSEGLVQPEDAMAVFTQQRAELIQRRPR